MISILIVIGIITLVGAFIIGIFTHSFLGFLLSMASGIASASVFFALARILENQDDILYRLHNISESRENAMVSEIKTCTRCSKQYDSDMSSCPHCGHRE